MQQVRRLVVVLGAPFIPASHIRLILIVRLSHYSFASTYPSLVNIRDVNKVTTLLIYICIYIYIYR